MNQRKIGQEKENYACEYLKEKGYHILEQNFRTRQGEIDVIAMDKDCLVFIEIKYRKNKGIDFAIEAVDVKKQQQISKVALYYIQKKQISMDREMRFDVVSMDDHQILLIKNAFEFQLEYYY